MLNAGGSDTAPYAHGTKYQFQLPAPAERYLASAVLALATKNPHAKIAIAYADDPVRDWSWERSREKRI